MYECECDGVGVGVGMIGGVDMGMTGCWYDWRYDWGCGCGYDWVLVCICMTGCGYDWG